MRETIKERLTINKIKTDLLKQKHFDRFERENIKNDKFYIIEDICKESSYRCKRSLSFVIEGTRELESKYFIIPNDFPIDSWQGQERYFEKYKKTIHINHRFYIIKYEFGNRVLAYYDADYFIIDDVLIAQKAEKSSLIQKNDVKEITPQFLEELSVVNLFGRKSKSYLIAPYICVDIDEGGGDDTTRVFFSDGNKKLSFTNGLVDKEGIVRTSSHRIYEEYKINQLYYVASKGMVKEYVFSADYWETSNDFVQPSMPIPKPEDRKEYRQVLEVYTSKGLACEIYGNNTVSVVNYADAFYGISDYRKTTNGFVFVQADYSVVRLLFNHPEALPIIMSVYQKIRLSLENLIVSLTDLAEKTQQNGLSGLIDKEMEKEILTKHQYNIFE